MAPTLLETALAKTPVRTHVKVSDEEIDLAIAFISSRITIGQARAALFPNSTYQKNGQAMYRLIVVLREAHARGKFKLVVA